MSVFKSLDIKIANFINRCINYYVKKRSNIQPPPTDDDIWNSLFTNSNKIEHELENNVRIILYKDSILCKLIYFGFEQTEISFVKKFLRKGDVFIDVGANIGLYSLYASKIIGSNGKIYAFEPTPVIFDRLKQNIRLNNFENIEPHNIGLSNSKSFIDFNISNDGHDAWNSFAKLPENISYEKIKVLVDTLDSFISENKIKNISLIKLDVEGWEKFVLEGCPYLLNTDNPPVFLVEYSENLAFSAGYYLGELFDLMKYYGYEWYSYNHESNVLKKEKKKLHYPYENLIAIKNFEFCNLRLESSNL